MIEIEAPDGSIVEFPDGTPDATIEGAMRSTFGGAGGVDTAADSAARGLPPLPPRSGSRLGEDSIANARRFLREDAPFAPEGYVGAIPGMLGNFEALGRNVLALAPNLGQMLPQQSIASQLLRRINPSTDPLLPTSTETTNEMFGAPQTEGQARGRAFGSMFSPLGARAGALEGAAQQAAKVDQALAAARAMSTGPERRANEILLRTLAKDKLSPENAAQALQQFGDKPLTIADVAGPATARKARLVNTLGTDGDDMSSFLTGRQMDQHGRVADDIAANLGQGGDIYSMSKRMMQSRDATARPLYQDAFAQNENITSPVLDEILSTDAGKQALADARTMMRNERLPMGEAERAVPPVVGPSGRTVQMGDTRKGDTLYEAIRKFGGIRTDDAQGFISKEGGEVRHALKDVRTSGIVNNRNGLTPDKMREALAQDGWFGRHQGAGGDIDEFYQALRNGREMYHPESPGAGGRVAEANARNLGEVRDLADELGVGFRQNWGEPQLDAAFQNAERSAIATGGELPGRNLQTLDYVKRALDDKIGVAKRAGERNQVRVLSALKNDLVRELDRLDVSGNYGKARAAYSGPTQSTEALETGADFLKMSTGEIADTLKGLGKSDADFFRVGAAQKLRDIVDAAQDNHDVVRRIFGNQKVRGQIEAVFGKEATQRMAMSMSAENMMTGTNRMVLGNSTTANKLADVAEAGPGAQIAEDAAKGFVAGGFRGAVTLPLMNQATNKISEFFNQMPPAVRLELAKRFTAAGPEAQNMLSQLVSQSNALKSARAIPGGANIPSMDPRVLAALLAAGGASKVAQQ